MNVIRSLPLTLLVSTALIVSAAGADDKGKDKGTKGTVTTKVYTTGCVDGVYAFLFCPEGYVATGGGGQNCNTLHALIDTFPVVSDAQGNPLTPANGDTPTGWFAQNTGAPEHVAAWVVCAPGP